MLGEEDVFLDDGVVFHELQLLGGPFRVFRGDVVKSAAGLGHETD